MPRPSRMRSSIRPKTVGLGSWMSSPGRSGYMDRMTCPIGTPPRPPAASNDLPSAIPRRLAPRASVSWSGMVSRRRFTSRWRISRPSWQLTVSSSCRIHCLILWRARPLRTWESESLPRVELAVGPEDRCVQRLVPVGLRRRDIVLESLLERRPDVVDHAEHVIAVRHRPHDDPERHHVVDGLERRVALAHLLPDGPEIG